MSVAPGRPVRRALVWSTASSLTVRLGGLVVGIALARLLTPSEFGVYAVALTVQAILMTVVDLGLGVDLVRTADPERRAPTVATIGLVTGGVLTLGTAVAAPTVAGAFRVPDASPVLGVMSLTLLVSGFGVVPGAMLQRGFEQKKLFVCSATDFVVSTVVTVGLVLLGLGPMALAVGRVLAQSSSTALLFVLGRRRPRFGFDRAEAGPALRFGIPVASANMLSWALLSIDNVTIARVAGAAPLGYYVLAFNIASWPMTAIGQAIRAVSLAAFAESARARSVDEPAVRDRDLAVGTAFSWAVGLPAGVLLAALSAPLIGLLYGPQWTPAAAALAALGFFGALRVLFDLMATYLMARGAPRPVLWIQIAWIVALVPAMVVGIHWGGIAGAGWAHVVVGAGIVLPAYLGAAHRMGADTVAVIRAMVPPALAAIPTWLVATAVAGRFDSHVTALVVGALAGAAVYVGLLHRWLLRLLRSVRSARVQEPVQGHV